MVKRLFYSQLELMGNGMVILEMVLTLSLSRAHTHKHVLTQDSAVIVLFIIVCIFGYYGTNDDRLFR